MRSIEKGRLNQAQSTRDIIQDKEEAIVLEKEHKLVKTEQDLDMLIKTYEQDLAKDAGNKQVMKNLADAYLQKNAYDRALEYYSRLSEMDKADPYYLQQAIKVGGMKFDALIEEKSRGLAKSGAAGGRALEELESVKREKLAFEKNNYKEMAARYPGNLKICYKYAQICMELGDIDSAVANLQKAVKSSDLELEAMYMLGLCFMEKELYDMAVETYKKIEAKLPSSDHELYKDTLYNLARALECSGSKQEASVYYKKIYEVDITYKDVKQKVEKKKQAGS